jgi:endonuclease YncB( thermonuclease family)
MRTNYKPLGLAGVDGAPHSGGRARKWCWMVAVALLVGAGGTAWSDSFTGQASLIDGDTLEIHGTRIRLWGIDAPESSQLCRGDDSLPYRCGAKAANDLDAFIAGRPVSCLPISLDRYGRAVTTCAVGGADLGDWLVRNGLALDWPEYSKRKYERRSATPNGPAEAYGGAATSSRGCIGSASGRMVHPPAAPMTPAPIPDEQQALEKRDRRGAGRWRFCLPLRCRAYGPQADHWGGCSYGDAGRCPGGALLVRTIYLASLCLGHLLI